VYYEMDLGLSTRASFRAIHNGHRRDGPPCYHSFKGMDGGGGFGPTVLLISGDDKRFRYGQNSANTVSRVPRHGRAIYCTKPGRSLQGTQINESPEL
jgi:hypothetical protein